MFQDSGPAIKTAGSGDYEARARTVWRGVSDRLKPLDSRGPKTAASSRIMQSKKLTGWLIAIIVWIGVVGFSTGVRNLTETEAAYRPYLAQYPPLRTAIMVFQLLLGAGVAAWAYAAWVLYRREPGTLGKAQTFLIVGALLRIGAIYSIPLFGGFPANAVRTFVNGALPLTFISLLFTGICYTYLARSQKVREIYAG